jgi:hypothetical protein
MKTNGFTKVALAAGLGAVLCSPAWADNCNGRFTNVGQSVDTLDLGKGHTLTTFVARGTSTSENSVHNGVGGCGGYVLTTPDGKMRLGYACVRKNQDGDSYSDAGTIEPGESRGTWMQTGGTGVFAGKNNSGWWQVTMDDGKVTSGIWGGNCR